MLDGQSCEMGARDDRHDIYTILARIFFTPFLF